jgi:RNA polymerase sigma-70 factor (ECF subfamily)
MPAARSLSQILLGSLPGAAPPSAPAALEQALVELLANAKQTYPGVEIGPETYLPYLAERLSADVPAEQALAAVQAIDLYLACACANGNEEAIALFDRRLIGEVDAALAHVNADPSTIQEVKQSLRERLLVGRKVDETNTKSKAQSNGDSDGFEPPKIIEYAGRGGLKAWVRVIAVRAALMIRRKGKREVLGDDALYALPAPAHDPELEILKQKYRAEFQESFRAALETLSDRQKNVLRQHFLYGLSIDQIGALYHVHRATAARWIAGARDKVFAETRASLVKRLRVTRPEVDSILRLIQSRLDVSLRDFL